MTLWLKNQANEQRLFRRRLVLAIPFILLLLGLLICRLIYLQSFEHQHYRQLAKNNAISVRPLQPTRGLIYDRNGILLAKNIPAYQLQAIPEQLTQSHETLLSGLSKIGLLDTEDAPRALERLKRARAFEPAILKVNLSEKQVANFMSDQYRFEGVSIEATLIRDYPLTNAFAHTIGYVGRISEEELTTLDKQVHAGNEFIGKNGVEQYYQSLLVGEQGFVEIEVDATGRRIKEYMTRPAIPGTDLYLTLDARLQTKIVELMENKRGAVVVLDPRNGDVLAMVSHPAFDPNGFVKGWSNSDYRLLQNSHEKPLFNRVLQGRYPPASTLKPFVGLAGLEEKKITQAFMMDDPGWYQIEEDTRIYKDWRPTGHGRVSLVPAIAESCDTYFYYLAHQLGIDLLAKWLHAFGFGEKTYIDLPHEQKGIVPTPQWKQQQLGERWYTGETLNVGIGQGYLLTTPLQLATATAALSQKGSRVQPHILKGTRSSDGGLMKVEPQSLRSIKASDEHLSTIIKAMEQVIESNKGTARRLKKGLTYSLAGKTGTAQVFGLKEGEKYVKSEVEAHLRDHTLFIGFAPVEKPEVVITVTLENQNGSSDLARKVLDYYFELKDV